MAYTESRTKPGTGGSEFPSDQEAGRPIAVVGYDGSDHARAAVAYAGRRVSPQGRLIVVHAMDPSSYFAGTPYRDHFIKAYRERGETLLDEITPELADGVQPERKWVDRRPAEALVEVAREHDADEIVVGSRGVGRLRAALGSVSHALLHTSDRPVVVVPEGPGEV